MKKMKLKKIDFNKMVDKIKKIDFRKMSNKNVLIIGGTVIGVIVVLVAIFALISRSSQEDKLKSKMEELGKNFYENFYYKQLGKNNAEFLKKYETLGIKVSLDNLIRLNTEESEKLTQEFVNKKTKEHCDKTKSQVIIYPVAPYETDSYTIKTELECGFKK